MRRLTAWILNIALVLYLGSTLVFRQQALSQSEALEAPPSSEVLQAIRLLLSGDRKEQTRGEAMLKRMGSHAAPQLRYWMRKVESEVDRVRVFLESQPGASSGPQSTGKLSADALFHRQLLEARAFSRAGEHQRALALAEAILLLDPSNPHAWELRRLGRQSRERIVSREILEPALEARKLVYEVGEEPQAMFRLVNHRDSEAIIEIQKEVLGEVEVTVTISNIDGSQKREQKHLRLRAPADVKRIVLGPRRVWEQEVPIDLRADLPLAGSVVRVQIGGRFRPTAWRIDGAEGQNNLGLTLGECELWIVPPGEGAHADNPLEKLALAVLLNKTESFFVGGQLAVWAAEDDAHFNEKLLITLLDSVDDLDPPRLQVAARFLAEITGEDFGADVGKWKAWWGKFQR